MYVYCSLYVTVPEYCTMDVCSLLQIKCFDILFLVKLILQCLPFKNLPNLELTHKNILLSYCYYLEALHIVYISFKGV